MFSWRSVFRTPSHPQDECPKWTSQSPEICAPLPDLRPSPQPSRNFTLRWCDGLSSRGHVSEIMGSSSNNGRHPFSPSFIQSNRIQIKNSRFRLQCFSGKIRTLFTSALNSERTCGPGSPFLTTSLKYCDFGPLEIKFHDVSRRQIPSLVISNASAGLHACLG